MVLLVKANYTNFFYFRLEDDSGAPMSLSGLNLWFQVINKKGEQVLLKTNGSGISVDPTNPGTLEVRLSEEESSQLASLPQPLSYVLYYESLGDRVVLSSGIIASYKFSGVVPQS